jgi:hypothetical protein
MVLVGRRERAYNRSGSAAGIGGLVNNQPSQPPHEERTHKRDETSFCGTTQSEKYAKFLRRKEK